jgi:hypothetical protein
MEALIIAAIGDIVGGAGDMVLSFNERQNVKDTLQAEREGRYYKLLDYEQQDLEKDNSNIIIIAIMAVVVIALIITAAFKK